VTVKLKDLDSLDAIAVLLLRDPEYYKRIIKNHSPQLALEILEEEYKGLQDMEL
jgi:hypothetical protein